MKHNRTILKTLLPIAGAVILTTASNAAVLAQYTFASSNDNTSDTDLNSTASSLGIGLLGTEFGTLGTNHGW